MKQMKQELQSTNTHILMLNKLSFPSAKSTDEHYRPHAAHRARAYQIKGFHPCQPVIEWIK